MHDLRLVAPAVAAWLTAFLVAGRSDAAGAAALVASFAAIGSSALVVVMHVRRAGRDRDGAFRRATRRASPNDDGARTGGRARFRRPVRELVAVGGLVAAVVALVAAAAALDAARTRPTVLLAAADAGTVRIEGVITGLVPPAALDGTAAEGASEGDGTRPRDEARFEVRTTRLIVDDVAVPIEAPVLVFGTIEPNADGGAPGIGSSVAVEGRLRATDPGDDVSALLFADATALVRAPPGGLLAGTDTLRTRFVGAASALPGVGGALLPGLAVGDTRGVPTALDADMKTSSLAHLTAVSGSNCAIVVAAVLLVGRALGVRRGIRVAAAALALAVFVLLVTPEGSVVRAAVMASVVLAAGSFGRRPAGVPLLALAVIVLLAVDPGLARDAGFALSVSATAGLVVVAGPLAERLTRVVPRPVAAAIAVPVAAQLCCQPVLLLLEPSVPVYGVVANLLAAPAAPIATVLGLLACLVGGASPAVAAPVLWLAWLPAQWIGMVATAVASWPGASWPWLPGVAGAVSFAALLLGVAALVGTRAREAPLRRLRLAVGGITVLVLVLWSGLSLGGGLHERLSRPTTWRFAACDVGQGDALLVRAAERIALIDTGADDVLLDRCLDLFGVDRVDLLVLSHFDHDHVGAADSLAGRVAEVAVPDTREAASEGIVTRLASHGAVVRPLAAGASFAFGDTSWRVLWPKAESGPSAREGNASSLAVRVDPTSACVADCLSLVALGDLGEPQQDAVLADSAVALGADVLKVSHHGSADQSAALTAAIGATVGVVSAGAGNDYGHPTDAALAMLDAAGTTPLRTDLLGTITIGSAGEGGETSAHGVPERGDGAAARPPVAVWSERGMSERGARVSWRRRSAHRSRSCRIECHPGSVCPMGSRADQGLSWCAAAPAMRAVLHAVVGVDDRRRSG
ncbi:ComEC/Rec2 family competence protein [Pseudoclavibacter chungangensis]|uniref:ComEC/Rec2 family competence protein n=1 Tax=Pseudoclavibacter chungangensis TaxID=587635 RepID=UPI003642D8D7